MTDRLVISKIETEHTLLLRELDRFKALSVHPEFADGHECSCTPDATAVCQKKHDDFSGKLLDMMLAHFADEEKLMRAPRELQHICDSFEAHKEAHADMTGKMVKALGAKTTRHQRSEIFELISHWLTVHINTHDKALLAWLGMPPHGTAVLGGPAG